MKLIRIKQPSVIARKKRRTFSKSWIRFFRILPFIILFLVFLAFSIFTASQTPRKNFRFVGYGGQSILLGASVVNATQKNLKFHLGDLVNSKVVPPIIWALDLLSTLRDENTSNSLLPCSPYQFMKPWAVDEIMYQIPTYDLGACCKHPHDPHIKQCPNKPSTLEGWTRVGAELLDLEEEDVLERALPLVDGGEWNPSDCFSKYFVAIIIPYRDRESHLLQLLFYLHPMLKRQKLHYRIFVVEQMGNNTFNKGMIMNAAFHTILVNKIHTGGCSYDCFIFHDVDMLPENDYNRYSCFKLPTHLSVAVNELGYKLPYNELAGGVFSIRTEQFLRVNGYSNLYWGWGGEDDDMGFRLSALKMKLEHPLNQKARYTMIKHEKRKPLAYKVRSKLVRTSKQRFRFDGLNTLKYDLINVTTSSLYTKILVDVGEPPPEIVAIQQEYELKFKN